MQSLAILEVVSRPGWQTVQELTIAALSIPDGSVVGLDDLGLLLPTNWNVRPLGPNAQSIGREFSPPLIVQPWKVGRCVGYGCPR